MPRRPVTYRWLLALAIMVGLGGCGTKAPAPGGTGSGTVAAKKLVIAAASDLKFALDDLLHDFRRQEPGLDVQVSYGSSGNFFQQLQRQAPFDVFLSADLDYVRKLDQAGVIAPGSEFQYARGGLVVWVRNESPLDLGTDGKAALADPAAQKIAVANPQTAPYGRAAVAALKTFGLYEQLQGKLVQGENIAQTAQFVESGAADIGILALSLAVAPAMKDKGRYVAISPDAYPPLQQAGAVLRWAQDPASAASLRAFMLSPAGRAKLRQYGFTTPED